MDEPHRAWPDLMRLPAGRAHELIYAPLDRAAHLVPAERARLLVACQGFATLDEHAASLVAGGVGELAAVRAHLGELAREGLLVPASALADRACAAAPEGEHAEPPRVTSLGIPTRDRVGDVRAALTSYAENARAHGRALDYVVVEGEVGDETRAATRASLAELGARYGVVIAHAGFPERRAYAAALARRAGVPGHVTEFALLNPEGSPNDTGSGRNALLLHAVGEVHVQVDDDTLCNLAPAPAPSARPGLSLTSLQDPSESWFPPRGAPVAYAAPQPSYVGLHEALLGRNVSACARDARPQGLELARAGAVFFRRLGTTGGRVLYTQIGAAGDTGSGSMWHYLLLSGETRERLFASEESYRRAFTSRYALRVAPRAAISDGSFCLGMTIGLDGRDALPPFLPMQRNTDGVFGVVARVCWRDAFVGFIPWMIEHTKLRTTTFADFFAGLGHAWAEDMLCMLIAASRVEADRTDPRQSLRVLGATLERWGALPPADFEELVRVQVLRARSLDLALFDDALRVHRGAPAYWARDVERAATLLRASLSRASYADPSDLAETRPPAEARAAMARMVRRYGELLRLWPDLLEAARDLRREGVRVAAPVR